MKVFICYAREDEALRQGLERQLRVLRRQGLITVWQDRDISPGAEWEREIDIHLSEAQLILLLVSPDFIDSDYCYGIEMKQALKKHEQGEATVIPVILRHVYWQGTPFGKLQALPRDATPVIDRNWHSVDEAFFDVAEGIRKVVEEQARKANEPKKAGEIVEEQLKRARRRKREMEEIISQARTIQYGSLDTPTILRKGQESGGARYEELSREQKEIAGIPDIYVRERLEAARQRENSINEHTTDIAKLNREALLSGRGMSGEEFLDHWRAILIVYQQRLDVLNGRIRELETVQANSLTTVRGIIEEQLKRARRRKKEIQVFITEAEHMQGNLLQSSKRLLNAMSHLNGARDDEFTITEKNENASVGNPAVQSQLEQLRWQEKLHHERTRDNMTRPHTDPVKSATSMSDDQLLDHWKTILAAYRERLGVIEIRIRELETIQARLAAGKI